MQELVQNFQQFSVEQLQEKQVMFGQLPSQQEIEEVNRAIKKLFIKENDPKVHFADMKLFGKGSSGRVFRARRVDNNKVVAVKVIAKDSFAG